VSKYIAGGIEAVLISALQTLRYWTTAVTRESSKRLGRFYEPPHRGNFLAPIK
jgi:hypothetical protein